jgi:hypothetical protein
MIHDRSHFPKNTARTCLAPADFSVISGLRSPDGGLIIALDLRCLTRCQRHVSPTVIDGRKPLGHARNEGAYDDMPSDPGTSTAVFNPASVTIVTIMRTASILW